MVGIDDVAGCAAWYRYPDLPFFRLLVERPLLNSGHNLLLKLGCPPFDGPREKKHV
jgi:hypothetical protein